MKTLSQNDLLCELEREPGTWWPTPHYALEPQVPELQSEVFYADLSTVDSPAAIAILNMSVITKFMAHFL